MDNKSTKLFVGGVAYSTTEDELRAFFEGGNSQQKGFKVVSVKVITDRETGRSRGFGFVEFETEEDASEALKLDGEILGGRNLKLSIARPQEDRPRGPRSDGGNGGDRW